MTELDTLAHELAYSTARADIECYCASQSADGTMAARWWDTEDIPNQPPETVADIQLAVRYLDLRGKLVRHPEHPEWVRLLAEAA